MSKYVIIGGSAAGIGAVEAIREVDPVGTMTVISEEPFPQYSRPMLSDFLEESVLQKMKYRNDNFWKKNETQVLKGRKAVRLDLTKKYVELDKKNKINFEKLLIATGGKPIFPKIEGVDKDGVLTFTTFADAERLLLKIEKGKKVVVIGGGLIGVSVAEALMKRGLKVCIIELKDRILNLILDKVSSKIIEDIIRKAGVTIVLGKTVQRILGNVKDDSIVGGVILTSGEEISCDLVIFAIGVLPRTEITVGTDVKVNKGIIVDKFMHTNVPDIYASGDVAEVYDFILGDYRPLPLWPIAHIGGRVAGYNMAGKKTEYLEGTSMSSLKYFGLPVISVGIVNPTEDGTYEILVDYDPSRNLYRKIVLKDNVIIGMIFVNAIEKAGIIFHFIKNHVNVKAFKKKLVLESFSLASIPLALRKKMFMGI